MFKYKFSEKIIIYTEHQNAKKLILIPQKKTKHYLHNRGEMVSLVHFEDVNSQIYMGLKVTKNNREFQKGYTKFTPANVNNIR